MTSHTVQKIVLIGAGRLATNFAFSLRKKNFRILQVYNRTREPGLRLANQVSSLFIHDIKDISPQADLYAIAVSDQVLMEVAQQIRLKNQLVIHFSGTADLALLDPCSSNTGILYAPQTFTYNRKGGFLGIPLCIEARNDRSRKTLADFASVLSDNIYHVGSAQRRALHLSAIFAGNFTNFMYAIAEEILKEADLPMTLLEPIIKKISAGAAKKDIFLRQTGPAIREDHTTIRDHLRILSEKPEFRDIYQLLTESIIHYKHRKENDKL
jgi:predicted short-subunit dehydrogenase-like oxidoreductase (DUF2520 family)